jgi:hypothetical protein
MERMELRHCYKILPLAPTNNTPQNFGCTQSVQASKFGYLLTNHCYNLVCAALPQVVGKWSVLKRRQILRIGSVSSKKHMLLQINPLKQTKFDACCFWNEGLPSGTAAKIGSSAEGSFAADGNGRCSSFRCFGGGLEALIDCFLGFGGASFGAERFRCVF